MSSRGNKWTPEQTEQLRALHEKGLSCALMAAEIGCGFTRNAIIGRLHRLGLSNAKSKKWKDRWANRPKSEKPRENRKSIRIIRANGNSDKMRFMEAPETDLAPLRCVEVVPLNLALVDLAHDGCRYPYGDGPFRFCGHPQIDGSSYCGPHWSITYARSRQTNPAATESRRRNFRKQYKLTLLEAAE